MIDMIAAPGPGSARVRPGTGLEHSGLSIGGFGPPLEAPGDARLDPEHRKLKALAREFEAVMLGQLMSTMRANHLAKDPLSQGQANKIFRDMMDQQTAREMARRTSLGIADAIYAELSRNLDAKKADSKEGE